MVSRQKTIYTDIEYGFSFLGKQHYFLHGFSPFQVNKRIDFRKIDRQKISFVASTASRGMYGIIASRLHTLVYNSPFGQAIFKISFFVMSLTRSILPNL